MTTSELTIRCQQKGPGKALTRQVSMTTNQADECNPEYETHCIVETRLLVRD